ncbi:MAG TPA: hypothetical protein VGI54_01725 [Solirubrobacteraceae bacterium]
MTAPLAALAAALAGIVALVARRRTRAGVARILRKPTDNTETDERGAVRSGQRAELVMPSEALDEIWTPMHLGRLARTYWRFLTRTTLGVIRVKYTDTTRSVVVLFRPFRLLRFQNPEYAMDDHRGIVRWRIEDGVLVARNYRNEGYLQIDVTREAAPADEPGCERLCVEVAVVNFYPAIAFRLGRWLYAQTQSRIHVVVTYGFLRSLRRLDLAQSRVGRFASRDEVPDPPIGEEARETEGELTQRAPTAR